MKFLSRQNGIRGGSGTCGKHSSAAFTLVEIMMALAIFGLVLTSIYACWTLIVRSAKVSQAATARVQRQRVAIRTIEEALYCARSFAADLEHYGFEAEDGDDAMLSFAAYLPQSFPRSGKFGDFNVRRVIFSLENAPEGGRQLVLRQFPVLMDMDEDEQNHPLVLGKNVEKMTIEFWDARKADFVEKWDQTNSLPQMVKVTLEFSDPNQRYNYSAQHDVVARVVKIPTTTVPVIWQTPNKPGGNPAQPVPIVRPGQPPPPQ